MEIIKFLFIKNQVTVRIYAYCIRSSVNNVKSNSQYATKAIKH